MNENENQNYPLGPGHRNIDTSIEAAERIKTKAAAIRTKVMLLLEQYPAGMNSYELAVEMNERYHDVQPRTSELLADDIIMRTGLRRSGRTKALCDVYVINPTPDPNKKEELKPVGNAQLWGEMMRLIYAYAHDGDSVTFFSMRAAAGDWATNMADKIAVDKKYS